MVLIGVGMGLILVAHLAGFFMYLVPIYGIGGISMGRYKRLVEFSL